MTVKAPLSVIILTFNEEANIERALRSVLGWAQEVFIVDSYSTDRTIDIALEVGKNNVQVVQHPFENYSAQWNWALSHLPITQPWTMKLDADEAATDDFRNEVANLLSADGRDQEAFVVHWHLIFMGSRLRWGGLFPNGNVRIWRSGRTHFEDRDVNEHVIIQGDVGEIKAPIEHHDYKSLSHWLSRHNRYSSMEARAIAMNKMTGDVPPRLFGRPDERRMWLRRLYYRIPCRPIVYFLYRYVFRMGFLDGRAGFRFAFLHSSYFYWIDLKRWEHQFTRVEPEVLWQPRGTPHPLLVNSPLQRQVDNIQLDFSEAEIPAA